MVVVHQAVQPDAIVGASRSLVEGDWTWPVHGMRHPPQHGTSGWYIWSGDLSDGDDFFVPWHAAHLVEQCPAVQNFLALPPGSRFLIAPGHEDVWKGPSLLDV